MPEEEPTKMCFVIAPISEQGSLIRYRSDNVLDFIIKPAATTKNYKVQRADDLSTPGVITEQIVERIKHDDLVIADLTGGNPNVFYELAVRHAVSKPTIQIIEQGEHPPFDVAGMRTISFNHQDLRSSNEAIQEIIEAIEETEKDTYQVVSPLSAPLGPLDNLRAAGSGDTTQILNNLAYQVRNLSRQIERTYRTSSAFLPQTHLADITARGIIVQPHDLSAGTLELSPIQCPDCGYLNAPTAEQCVCGKSLSA